MQEPLVEHYDFGPSFQVKILALASRDPGFYQRFHDVIRPEFFEDFACQKLCYLVKEYWRSFSKLPTLDGAEAMVQEMCTKQKLPEGIRSSMFALLHKVVSVDLSDAAFIQERVVRFGKRQLVKTHVLELVNHINADQDDLFDGDVERLKRALLLGEGTTDLGYNLGTNFLKLPQDAKESMLFNKKGKVPTSIHSLDQDLRGGLGPGEVGVILGYTGYGKSLLMTSMVANAVKKQKVVVYYTLELPPVDVSLRISANLTEKTIDQILDDDSDYYVKVMPFQRKRLSLYVVYYTPKSVTVAAIRSHLSHLRALHNIEPSVVFVDYADKLLGTNSSTGKEDNTYAEMGNVYEGLVALSADFQVPVWTGSQVQRGAKSEDPSYVTELNAVADSFRKVTDADVVISLNQTKKEKEKDKLRIYTAKMRRGVDGKIIPCKVNYPYYKIQEII
jgi:replicative DNA helicase